MGKTLLSLRRGSCAAGCQPVLQPCPDISPNPSIFLLGPLMALIPAEEPGTILPWLCARGRCPEPGPLQQDAAHAPGGHVRGAAAAPSNSPAGTQEYLVKIALECVLSNTCAHIYLPETEGGHGPEASYSAALPQGENTPRLGSILCRGQCAQAAAGHSFPGSPIVHQSVPGGGSSSESTKHRRARSHRGFATSWRVTSRRRARPGLGSGHGTESRHRASGMAPAPAGGTGAPRGLASCARHKAWDRIRRRLAPSLATEGRWEPSPGEHQAIASLSRSGF